MPVSYRVWVSGFADEERRELRQLFANRSLIAYQAAEAPEAAELLVVDADQPQTFAELGQGLDAGHALYIGHALPQGARWHLPRPLVPGLVLRMLDELVARERPAPHRFRDAFERLIGEGLAQARASARRGAGAPARPPTLGPMARLDFVSDGALVATGALRNAGATEPMAVGGGDADAGTAAVADPPASGEPAGAPAMAMAMAAAAPIRLRGAAVERRQHKQRHRGAVRRTRVAPRTVPLSAAVQVLVVDGHPPTRLETGILLQAFGFRTHTVASLAEAERALWTQAFAVAFVGEPADGPAERAGIDLCHRIKQGGYGLPDQPQPKVVMLARAVRPSDAVRARLAGCDHLLCGPATRGSLALALEAIDLSMPLDPRASG